MRNASRYILCIAANLILAATLWALPGTTSHSAMHRSAVQTQAAPQTQSVSGTIASVGKTSFTLTVSSQPPSSEKHAVALQSDSPKSMTFQIDANTTVDGTLKVGSSADVTYRQDSNGNNVAISVHVSS